MSTTTAEMNEKIRSKMMDMLVGQKPDAKDMVIAALMEQNTKLINLVDKLTTSQSQS